jgi:hypothetical protein
MSVFRSLAAGLLAASSLVHAQDSVSFDINSYGQGDASGTPFQTYQSNSDLKPPQLQINKNSSGLAPGYVFIGVDGAPTSTQNWPTIFDMSEERMGTLVWTGNYAEVCSKVQGLDRRHNTMLLYCCGFGVAKAHLFSST